MPILYVNVMYAYLRYALLHMHNTPTAEMYAIMTLIVKLQHFDTGSIKAGVSTFASMYVCIL